ncbi:hypothetical protein PGTUg99_034719 [Puccinia graminis f. sp. tritici]|uniref:Uncharacterized protein n=1 Tax=Puccinia graminis f. sp. tritici TaxID=56615 RepID=A0A5B0SM93_PUCGR|nr:hypothetical protein PGTUg99_034719 [Puccinia graminis f. sp. tritici]
MAFIEVASKIGFTNNSRDAGNLPVLFAARFIHNISMDFINAILTYAILKPTRPLADTLIGPTAAYHCQPPL